MANIRGGSRAGGSTVLTRDNLLRFLLMVDGPGSEIDADTLDGLHAKDFASSGHNHNDIYLQLIGGTMKGPLSFKPDQWWFINSAGLYGLDLKNSDIKGLNALIFQDDNNSDGEGIFFPKTGKSGNSTTVSDYDRIYALDGKMYLNENWVLTNAMMGHGNGIDADTVDGKHASEFLLLTGGTMTGNLSMSNSEIFINDSERGITFFGGARIYRKSGSGLRIKPNNDAVGIVIANAEDEDILTIKNSEFHYKTNKIWHKGNQGHNSGMDADTVDGKHATEFATSGHNHDGIYLKLIGGSLTGALNIAPNKWWFANGEFGIDMKDSDIVGIGALIFKDLTTIDSQEGLLFPKQGKTSESRDLNDYDNLFCNNGKIYINSDWALTNAMMGHGKGIDSDKLDGLHATSFFRTDIGNSCDVRINGADGRGVRFWDNDMYKIYMSASNSSSCGGRAPGETITDYNMYFKMSNNGGSGRGFVFLNDRTPVGGIDHQGQLYLKKGITAGNDKFTIEYNNDTESIDFIIN